MVLQNDGPSSRLAKTTKPAYKKGATSTQKYYRKLDALYCYTKWVNWEACAKKFDTIQGETIGATSFLMVVRIDPKPSAAAP